MLPRVMSAAVLSHDPLLAKHPLRSWAIAVLFKFWKRCYITPLIMSMFYYLKFSRIDLPTAWTFPFETRKFHIFRRQVTPWGPKLLSLFEESTLAAASFNMLQHASTACRTATWNVRWFRCWPVWGGIIGVWDPTIWISRYEIVNEKQGENSEHNE